MLCARQPGPAPASSSSTCSGGALGGRGPVVLNTVAFSRNLLLKAVPFFFSAKEEEKQKLLKWSSDLKQEREQLEQKVKQLSNSISVSDLVPSATNTRGSRTSDANNSSRGSQGWFRCFS